MVYYSLRNANTGSSLAAFLDGIMPPIRVNTILNIIKIIPAISGNDAAIFAPFAMDAIILLVGISNNKVIPIPITPARVPIIIVSALNTCATLRLEAPIALKIPISFLRSNTLIYVIIPIIIEETISDIIENRLSYEDVDEFDMSLICSALHCDTQYFIDAEVRNKDLLISTMNRGKDSVKSKTVKAKIQDFMKDFAFVNEVLLEEA